MPILLITAGPTGSGKSTLIQESFTYLIGHVPDFETFLVDDLVENDDSYKQEVDKIIKDFSCKPPFDSGKCDVTRPTEALLLAFKQAYFKIRLTQGCMRNEEKLNCNELNDKKMVKALKENKNVVIETTGSYIPTWILDLEFKNYQIVFSYSIVSFDILLMRNATRATRSLMSYFKDHSQPGPRLIDIRQDTFLPIVVSICNTLIELRNKCLVDQCIEEKCFSRTKIVDNNSISNLLIFDNSKTKFQNIYDHRKSTLNPNEFSSFIRNAFFKTNF